MVSFVPLLIQIGVVSLVGRYMGAGRPRSPSVTRSGLKMGWSYSSVILVLFVGFPEQLVAVFQPRPGPHQAAPRRRHATGRPLHVLADAMMVVFSGAPARRRGYLLDMCISVGLHWLLPVLFITLKILQLSPQTAWLALVILFFLQRRFYLRYRSGHWKTLTVVGERQTVSRE